MKTPTVSVIMSVFNGENYLRDAIDSILNQDFKDFEFIIINDASKDKSEEIIRSYADSRIIYITNRENIGLARSLNKGIRSAKGEYIARMDADDISFKARLSKQVGYLENHQNCVLLGTWAEIWKNNSKTQRIFKHNSSNNKLKFDLLINNPFVHSSVIIRKKTLKKVGLYNEDFTYAQDYELWSRIGFTFEVANIPEVLHVYREVDTSISRSLINKFEYNVLKISSNNIYMFLEKQITIRDAQDFSRFLNAQFPFINKDFDENKAMAIFQLIIHQFKKNNLYDKDLDRYMNNIFRKSSQQYSMSFPFLSRVRRDILKFLKA